MKIKVQKSSLMEGLNIVNYAISTHTTLEVLKTILFVADGNKLYLRATNMIMEIEAHVFCEVIEEGTCCVSDLIVGVISMLDDDEIEINVGKKFNVKQGKRKHSYAYIDSEDFPKRIDVDEYVLLEDGNWLADIFKKAMVAVATGESRPMLTTCNIDTESGWVSGADGYRVSLCKNMNIGGSASNPHADLLHKVLSIIRQSLEISFGEWNGFRSDDFEIKIQSMQGEYPNVGGIINPILEKSSELILMIQKESLKRVLDICSYYSKKADSLAMVILNWKDNQLEFSMSIPNLVEMKEHVEVESFDGLPDFAIAFNPNFMNDAVKVADGEILEFRFNDNNKPFLMIDNDFYYLQMPMLSREDT